MEQMYLFDDEEWRGIAGYDGYEVSNLGNVRSWWKPVSRGVGNGKGCGGRVIGSEFKLHKQHVDSDGYRVTCLTGKDKKYKTFKVHRLVAMAFIPNPNNLPQVNHKDENKQNNCVWNLEWCTNEYNVNYGTALRRGALKRMKAVSRYDLQGNYIDSFESASEAMKQTNIRHIVSACLLDRLYAGGYQWRYTDSTENIAPYVKKPHIPVNNKRVECYDMKGNFVKAYNSIAEASVDNGVSVANISGVLHGRQHSAAGYTWRFSDEG